MTGIFPAATVVLVRNGGTGLEVLLLRRSTEVSFAKASWVFPGGRIDRADYGADLTDIERAARCGAAREAMEETGLAVDPDSMVYFAHWTTPPTSTRRYATWFFIAPALLPEAEVTVDGSEIVGFQWYRPQQAIADHHAGKIAMMPPTLVTLSEMIDCDSVTAAMDRFGRRPVSEYLPRFTVTDDGIAVLYAGDAGYESGDPDVDGPRHRCCMLDEAWRYEKRG